MTLPPSFFFWVFLPGRGVVKAVCEPTTSNPETAEVAKAVLVEHDKKPALPPCTRDEQRRIDEAASDALASLRYGLTEANAEAQSIAVADAAEERHLSNRYTHPDDRTLPAWQE